MLNKEQIIDSHQHFWQPGKFEYPWMNPHSEVLFRDYLPQNLLPELEKCGVSTTIAVQASNSREETRWLLELGEENEFIGGVVGWVDLSCDEVGAHLEEFARYPKFKGVRHLIEAEPADDWMIDRDVLHGLGLLASYGLTYDMLVHTRHLKYLEVVAERCPGLPIVIDHLAKPPIASREFAEWAEAISRVASHRNIHCKLSGLVTEADHKTWKVEDLKPYVDHVLEFFGPRRMFFGSDYPVCLLAASYADVLNAFEVLLEPLSDAERRMIFVKNARRFYKL